jgi:hypothetical protein
MPDAVVVSAALAATFRRGCATAGLARRANLTRRPPQNCRFFFSSNFSFLIFNF